MSSLTHITVLLPTRDRVEDLRRCLASLAAVRYPSWDLLVLDQGTAAVTEALLREVALPEVVLVPLASTGLSRARNAGLALARGPLVAFLDDDCTVAPDWLERVAETFAQHPDAGVVYGAVEAAPHDWRATFVPVCRVPEERVLRRRRDFLDPHVMGAAMYLRRSAVAALGPFDELLGAGSGGFPASEDWEYGYRALAHGIPIVRTPAVTVVHYGGREHASGSSRQLIRQSAYSNGATDMKLLRCGESFAVVLIAARLWRGLRELDLVAPLLRRGPSNAARLVYYLRGLAASFRLRVDRRRWLFVAPPGTGSVPSAAPATQPTP